MILKNMCQTYFNDGVGMLGGICPLKVNDTGCVHFIAFVDVNKNIYCMHLGVAGNCYCSKAIRENTTPDMRTLQILEEM